MNWSDCETYIELFPPKEFNFSECLQFLNRSPLEILHRVKGETVYKLLQVQDVLLLCKISFLDGRFVVEFPTAPPYTVARKQVAKYIWEWFDMDQDLEEFYQLATQDDILRDLVQKYAGLRIMCIPDLFEVLSWAIMGQQINLTFAYTLKKRFVEQYGEYLSFEEEPYWLYPSAETIAELSVEDLRTLQFTNRKAAYIIELAKTLASGGLVKEELLEIQDDDLIRKALTSKRGIGPWTADYAMMKCLHRTTAFPVADVGLHNALKNQLGLDRKPTIEETKAMGENWKGWEAYATFYLWHSL
nr:DNA-3-methyladenine glycosylase [Bacillus coahuilensis]